MEFDEFYDVVLSSLQQRHPELSPEAAAALAIYYSYCNR